MLGALGDAAPPVLHTLHWDLRRNADFYDSFDGRGRVFFAGVSDSQIARGPTTLRRQTLGSVPLSVPIPEAGRRGRRSGPTSVLVLSRLCEAKGIDIALAPAGRPGCRWCSPDRSVASPTVPPWRPRSPTPRARCVATPTSAGSSTTSHPTSTGTGSAGSERGREREGRPAPAVPGGAVPHPLGGARRHRGLRGAGRRHAGRGDGRGCLPSLVEPKVTGYLAEDEADFTAALGRLAELDPEACAATARSRFSPEVMARGYERLYAELLARTGRGAPRGGRGERPANTGTGMRSETGSSRRRRRDA